MSFQKLVSLANDLRRVRACRRREVLCLSPGKYVSSAPRKGTMNRYKAMWIAAGITVLVTASAVAETNPPPRIQEFFQEYSTNCGLWRVDDGFVSTMQITNRLVTSPIEVSPVLYGPHGEAFRLPDTRLAASEVVTININRALAEAHSSRSRRAIPRYGSAVIVFKGLPTSALASMSIVNKHASLSYIAAFGPAMTGDAARQTLEGLWWRHDPGVEALLR
jgi:hypothetical protein